MYQKEWKMDANPWDAWLFSNVLVEAALMDSGIFNSEQERQRWRTEADSRSNRYQQEYASKRKLDAQADIPWWDTYVSKSELTWQYLDQLEHPLDIAKPTHVKIELEE